MAFSAGWRGVEQWNRNTAGIVRATVLPNRVTAAIVVSVSSISGIILAVASTARNRDSRLGSNGSYDGSLHDHCQFSLSTRPFGSYPACSTKKDQRHRTKNRGIIFRDLFLLIRFTLYTAPVHAQALHTDYRNTKYIQ